MTLSQGKHPLQINEDIFRRTWADIEYLDFSIMNGELVETYY